MESFAKIVNNENPLTIFAKTLHLRALKTLLFFNVFIQGYYIPNQNRIRKHKLEKTKTFESKNFFETCCTSFRNVYHLSSFKNVIKYALIYLIMKKSNSRELTSFANLKQRWSKIVEFDLQIDLLLTKYHLHFQEERFSANYFDYQRQTVSQFFVWIIVVPSIFEIRFTFFNE